MRLSEWQHINKIKNIELARRLQVHFSYVSLLVNGFRRPSYDVALKIERLTDGEVSLREAFLCESKKHAKKSNSRVPRPARGAAKARGSAKAHKAPR
jgi:DNA-binding transcriptional regulator YdaS (Cro superfamily)